MAKHSRTGAKWTSHFERENERLSGISRSAFESFNRTISLADWLPSSTSQVFVDTALQNMRLGQSMSELSPVFKLQLDYMNSYESLTRDISGSLLPYTTFAEQAMDNLARYSNWTRAFQFNPAEMLSTFLKPFSWEVPENLVEIYQRHRADFLLEEKLQFLLDVTDSAIDELIHELHKAALDARPAEVTKHLHRATSDGTFVSDMLQSISATPKIRGRRLAVESALEAHSARKYLLSIPALLPQVEALTMQLLAEAKYVKWDRRRQNWYETVPDTGEYRTGDKKQRMKVNGLGSLAGVVKRIENNPIPHGLPYLKEEVSRYRNSVLHGNLIRYGKPRESSRLVLLVMTLSRILESIAAQK